mgnify:CR=1 FL=1
MIRWLFKYSAVIFVFNTILLSIPETYIFGGKLFLFLVSVFSFFLILNAREAKKILFNKAFALFLIINSLNFLYFLFIHNDFSNFGAVKYLLARGVQFSIISYSIYYHYDFYKNMFLDYIVYLIFFIMIFGFVLQPDIFSSRYSGIIWNPNAFSSFILIAFGCLLLKNNIKSRFELIMIALFLLFALASGSRGALIAIPLAYFMKYGFSRKNILYGFLAFFIYLIMINLQYETSLNRFDARDLLNDRIIQYKYALASINNEFFYGYGLDKYSYIDKSLVPLNLQSEIIGAHNGYLAILTQYGALLGSIILFLILRNCWHLIYYFYSHDNDIYKRYLFILIYTLIAAFYESLIVGINEFHTILFWFSLAILSYSRNYYEDKSC